MLWHADASHHGMKSDSMTVVAILILLLSALITWLMRNRHHRTQWVVASLLGFVIWALMIFLDVEQAVVTSISVWQPEDLFQSPITLTIDGITWPLMYGAVTVLLAVILTSATRPSVENVGMRSFLFVYTSFALIAIMAANLLTTVIAWAMMDFGMLVFLLTISDRSQDRRAIFARAGVNAVSVLLLVAAAMSSEIQAVLSLDLASTTAFGIMLLAIAATFRLGLIPLHFALPPVAPLRKGVGTLLRLFPAVVAMAVLARVFEAGLPDALRVVFLVAGVTGGLLGGIRWVLQTDTLGARPFFVLGAASLGLIIATIAPDSSEIIVSSALVILLAGAVLSLFAQHTPSHRLVPIAVSGLIMGLPFTPGAVYAAAAANLEVFLSTPAMGLIAAIIASLLALGSFHLFFLNESQWPIGESIARVMFNLGLVLPILVSIGLGAWRLQTNPIPALIFSAIALVLSVGFFFVLRGMSVERIDHLVRFFNELEPERIYETVWAAIQRVLIALRGGAELLEGVSGMLWLFVFVIFMLFIIQ